MVTRTVNLTEVMVAPGGMLVPGILNLKRARVFSPPRVVPAGILVVAPTLSFGLGWNSEVSAEDRKVTVAPRDRVGPVMNRIEKTANLIRKAPKFMVKEESLNSLGSSSAGWGLIFQLDELLALR